MMEPVTTLLERPIYGMQQIDSLLGLASGTARRWIDVHAILELFPFGRGYVLWLVNRRRVYLKYSACGLLKQGGLDRRQAVGAECGGNTGAGEGN